MHSVTCSNCGGIDCRNIAEQVSFIRKWIVCNSGPLCRHLLAYRTTKKYKKSLIALALLPQKDGLGAENLELFLRKILLIYKMSLDDVVAIVDDSCFVKQNLYAITNIPFMGCAGHKLNLAIQK